MKYRPKIGGGDFDTKTRKVAEFLGQGHKVKITIMFRGREVAHPELGKRILDRIAEQLAPMAKIEAHPRLDGRNMTMVLAPDKRAQAAAARTPKPAPAADTPAADTADTAAADTAAADTAAADTAAAAAPPEAQES